MVEPWKVQVRFEDSWHSGLLSWSAEGPIVELDSGEEITSGALVKLNQEAIIDENGKTSVRPGKEYIIGLEPVLSREGTFAPVLDEPVDSSIYPPDTNLWYTRLLRGNEIVTFFLHTIEESAKYYLAIVHKDRLIQAHAIRQYEAGALRYETDAELWRKGRAAFAPNFDALAILDESSPDWKSIDKLTADVRADIRGETVGETFDGLVPIQWPTQVRQELKAFLAYICKGRPDEDPLDFFPRFEKYRMLYGLLLAHYRSMIQSVDAFPYVRWMWEAESRLLSIGDWAIPEEVELHPWSIFIYYLYRLTLDFERAAEITEKLNNSDRIMTQLPVSRKEAEESRNAWIERIWVMAMGLRIMPNVRASVLGLQEVIYLGRAQRWPHKHLRFMARVGDANGEHRYFHHMMMPPLAFQQLKTPIRDLSRIAFSAYSTNYHLYDSDENIWNVDLKALENRKNLSLDELKSRFGRSKEGFIGALSKKQATILDYVVSQGFLAEIEAYEGIPGTEIDQDTLERFLAFMRNGAAIDLTYQVSPYGLPTTFIEVEGKESTLCSLMAAFLDALPTCWAFIEPNATHAYALVRFSPQDWQLLSNSISNTEFEIRMARVSAFRGFTRRFFQRLATDGGEWNADVSEIISQKIL
jgi:hypothetical protein